MVDAKTPFCLERSAKAVITEIPVPSKGSSKKSAVYYNIIDDVPKVATSWTIDTVTTSMHHLFAVFLSL